MVIYYYKFHYKAAKIEKSSNRCGVQHHIGSG